MLCPDAGGVKGANPSHEKCYYTDDDGFWSSLLASQSGKGLTSLTPFEEQRSTRTDQECMIRRICLYSGAVMQARWRTSSVYLTTTSILDR